MAAVDRTEHAVETTTGEALALVLRPYGREEFELLRDVRVRMLEDAPDAFTITADAERSRPIAWWRDRLQSTSADPHRLALVAELHGEAVGSVLGVVDGF